MSQYPSPYQPPQGPLPYAAGSPYASLLQPIRRASMIMIVIGILGLTCGGLLLPGIYAMTNDQLAILASRVPGISLETLRKAMFVAAWAIAATSLALLTFGILARRGTRAAIIPALVLCILLGAYMVLSALGGLVAARSGIEAMSGLFFGALFGVPLILAAVWFISGLRNLPRMQQAQQQQYEQQYWAYMQQYNQWVQQSQQQQTPPNPPPQPPAPSQT